MADNVAITAGAGTTVSTEEVTTLNGGAVSAQHVQRMATAIRTADGTAVDLPGDATNGLDVDVTRLRPDGTNTLPAMDAAARRGYVQLTNGTNSQEVANNGGAAVAGCTAHDTADAGNPVKVGGRALAHGANPTAVAAGDRTDWLFNRAGVPWMIGGHPNVVTLKHTNITTAVTDAAIITVSAGTKIVVTRITVTLDNASTVFPTVLIGFGATTTPTTTGVLYSHGGFPAGGGQSVGDGSGIVGIGGDDQDLRITTTGNATGNGLQVTVSYYTIES